MPKSGSCPAVITNVNCDTPGLKPGDLCEGSFWRFEGVLWKSQAQSLPPLCEDAPRILQSWKDAEISCSFDC